MPRRVCPWWIGWILASPLRRLGQDPRAVLGPWVAEGMTVLEPGPGMGFFTLDLARLVGPRGRVVAVDVQPRMLAGLRRRARRAGLLERIDARLSRADTLGVGDLEGRVDLVLAFAVVHEVPDPARFFAEAAAALRPGGRLLLAEPAGHVSEDEFAATLAAAAAAGLRLESRPAIRRSRAAMLVKPSSDALAPPGGNRAAGRAAGIDRGGSRDRVPAPPAASLRTDGRILALRETGCHAGRDGPSAPFSGGRLIHGPRGKRT